MRSTLFSPVVRLRSQNSISRANGDRRSQIEKHVVVSVRSNLPQKVQQSFLNQSLDPAPNQKFLDLPLKKYNLISYKARESIKSLLFLLQLLQRLSTKIHARPR